MAEFNPDVPQQEAPDYSRRFSVPTADTSFGMLFQGIGEAVTGAAKTADNYIQNDIDVKARDSAERINQEMGFDPTNLPTEITQGENNLSRLAQAQAAGKITPEYYYQRLAMVTKGLRTRYPGYEKEVDEAIKRATGITPANAFRDALLSNINAANEAGKANANKVESFINSNISNADPAMAKDWFETGGQKYGGANAIAAKIAENKATREQIDFNQKQAAADATRSEQNFADTARKAAFVAVKQLNEGVIAQIGGQNVNIHQALSNLSSSGGGDPATLAAITSGLQMARTNLYNQLLAEKAKDGYSHLDPAKADAAIKSALEPYDNIIKMVGDKQYDAAARAATQVQLENDRATQQLYKADPNMKSFNALSKIDPVGTQTIMQNYYVSVAGTPEGYFNSVLRRDAVSGVLAGDVSIQDRAKAIVNNSDMPTSQRQKLVQGLIKDFSGLATKIKQDPEQVGQIIQKSYPLDPGQDYVWQVVQADQKMQLFSTLYSPAITKKVMESGNQEAIRQYSESAFQRIQSIPDFRDTVASLQQAAAGSRMQLPAWNPKTNRLEVQTNRNVAANAGWLEKAGSESNSRIMLQTFTDRFNQAMNILGPIAEAQGATREDAYKKVLAAFNTKFENGKEDGFFKRLERGIDVLTGSATLGQDNGMGENDSGESPGTSTETPKVPELNITSLNKIKADVSGKLDAEGKVEDVQPSSSGLKDIIGLTEGTDKGAGYNETFGHGRWTGQVDLENMSIDDVKNLQQSMLDRGSPATPVGRFQLNQATLADYQQKLNLPGSTKLTREVQDHIFDAIVKDSGYDDWKAGKLPDDVFLARLQGRWPSLPGGSQARDVGLSASGVLNAARGFTSTPAGTLVGQIRPRGELSYQGRTPSQGAYDDGGDVQRSENFLSSVIAPGTGAARSDAVSGLQPAMKTRLTDLLNSAPPDLQGRIGLYSAYRSPEVQRALYAASDQTGHMVARPGGSQHNWGSAVDLAYKKDDGSWVSLAKAPKEVKNWVKANAEKFNLKLPMDYEPWHIELAETRNFGYVSDKSKRFAGNPFTDAKGNPDDAEGDNTESSQPAFSVPLQAAQGLTGQGGQQTPLELSPGMENFRESTNVTDRRNEFSPEQVSAAKAEADQEINKNPADANIKIENASKYLEKDPGSIAFVGNNVFYIPADGDLSSSTGWGYLGTKDQWQEESKQYWAGEARKRKGRPKNLPPEILKMQPKD